MSGVIHWAHHWAIPIIAAWVAASILVAVAYDQIAGRAKRRAADENLLSHGAKLLRELNAQAEHIPVADGFPAIAEQLWPDPDTTRWPDVCGPQTPCDHEDGYVCVWHREPPHDYIYATHCDRCYAEWERNGTRRVGRHAAVWQTPLDDQPADVILAVVTEVQKRKQA